MILKNESELNLKYDGNYIYSLIMYDFLKDEEKIIRENLTAKQAREIIKLYKNNSRYVYEMIGIHKNN